MTHPRTIVLLAFSLSVLVLGVCEPAFAIVCPSGFLEVGNGSRTLGCIQEDEESEAAIPLEVTWEAAADRCFDRYGGRLPTAQEAVLADINAIVAAYVPNWTGSLDGNASAIALTGGLILETYATSATHRFRCWIPADSSAVASVPALGGWLSLVLASAIVWIARRELRPGRGLPRARP
jgi:hypothetical protein